ncbi:FUSC family protein [Pseudomonas sp. C32]|jgi:uncharacterized membrane protein YccC|uniref:FUSC family protein n=1 Tax=Pseudomonas sp. C32 TaxID=1529208 RepID=UPI002618F41E|nr:FUSC family protein [Pseudomonas sp. C32]MDN4546979.1 FUSC family protein [Pseudomonas sp. C32]
MSTLHFYRFVGIDRNRIRFALFTAVAAWLSIALATALDLPNAHWAGITVFTVAQPSRGLLIDRCMWRLVGTAVGAVVGVLLLILFGNEPALLVLFLSCWLAVCAAASALVRHFRSYGAVLAGYTGAIVALIDVTHPGNVETLAFGRIACTVIGVCIATLVSGFFVPASGTQELLNNSRRLSVQTLQWVADLLSGLVSAEERLRLQRLILDISNVEAEADEVLDGSAGARWRKRRLRNLLASLLAVVDTANSLHNQLLRHEAEHGDLDQVRVVLHQWLNRARAAINDGEQGTASWSEIAPHSRILSAQVAAFRQALYSLTGDIDALERKTNIGPIPLRLVSEPDWPAALRAALRTELCVLLVGGTWVVTGWSAGSFMLMGACVYITVFATNENGKRNARRVIPGVALGICAGYAFRVWLHPAPTNVEELLFGLLPFMLVSMMGLAMRITAISAVEFSNFFLMLVQPSHLTPIGLPIESQGLALMLGTCLSVGALHFLLPLDPFHRQRLQSRAIGRHLESLAVQNAVPSVDYWKARMYLRLLRWIARPGVGESAYRIPDVLLALDLGALILALRSYSTGSLELRAEVADLLSILGNLRVPPAQLSEALRTCSDRLKSDEQAVSIRAAMHSCADDIAKEPVLFGIK